ncbi:MAG: choice-of-anchor D domain-containing protein, partial [Planctomycetota bacterium]|nr:choice-of-anchor D domain-containing protein [Planctomycetota bacterium]
ARFSNFNAEGGQAGRLYRTTNGGTTWTELAAAGLLGENISSIAVRGANIVVTSSGNGGGVFTSTDSGATFTAIVTPFPAGNNFTDLVVDPSDVTGQRMFAANVGTGGPGRIYHSDDFGASWTPITGAAINPGMDALLVRSNVLEMTVHPVTGRLYVAILIDGQAHGLFRTNNATSASPIWTQMDVPLLALRAPVGINNASNATPPIRITSNGHGLTTGDFVVINGVLGNAAANGFWRVTVFDGNNFDLENSAGNGVYTAGSGTWTEVSGPNPTAITITEGAAGAAGAQGRIHFSMTVDPTDENILYIGGDRQDIANPIGDTTAAGAVFRADARVSRNPNLVPSPQWDHITHDIIATDPPGGTDSGSAPHAGSRELTFDANGELLEVDGGGIFRRTSPTDNTGDWFTLAGDLGVAEFHDIAYDSNSQVIIAGSQDNGTQYQIFKGDPLWEYLHDFLQGADGGDVAVDTVSLGGGQSIRYHSSQFFGGFTASVFNAGNILVSQSTPALALASGLNPIVPGLAGNTQPKTPMELNVVNPARMIIGGVTDIWESTDRGASAANIASTIGVNAPGAVAYGGVRLGINNEEVLYVGYKDDVYIRQFGTGAPVQSATYPERADASTIDEGNRNEVQELNLVGATSGQFTLTFGAEMTTDLNFNDPFGVIQTALETLPSIGLGNVLVTGGPPNTGIVRIEFQVALGGTAVVELVAADGPTPLVGATPAGAVTTTTQGNANELQQIDIFGATVGEQFTITFAGQTTANIPVNATAAQVQAALIALPNIGGGNVSVTGGDANTAPLNVTFTGALGGTDVAQLVVNSASQDVLDIVLDPTDYTRAFVIDSNSVYMTTDAGATWTDVTGVNETQELNIVGAASGQFTLSYNGVATNDLAFNATAATVQVELELLPGIGAGNVQVTGTTADAGVLTIEFIGALARTDVLELVPADGTMPLAGATAAGSVVTTKQGSDLMKLAGQAIRTIVFVPGTTGGIVVGGNLGLFSSLTNDLGTWVEVGNNLPNALVYDLQYNTLDDVLVAGTLGRGAWLLPNASRAVHASAEMDVVGNGASIVDGDITPIAVDGTNFGQTVISGGNVIHTFTIANTGNANLTLSGVPLVDITGTGAAEFTVNVLPGTTIPGGGFTTFQITFAPTTAGIHTATVTIANNDVNEGIYNFNIQGQGTATVNAAPTVTFTTPDGLPFTEGMNGGAAGLIDA